uniref:polyprenyl synthetase family protein n=1 Tax=uncultured Draconibacterium sp. TaxID=1573823 RepID=UPI003217B601
MYSVEELQKIIKTEIDIRSKQIVEQNPVELYEPISYSLGMGGKRLRPVLLLLAYNLFSEDIIPAVPAALAIEVFHNFTLLHDDIMDNADVRRNRPTVHKKFSENSAILSGDAMAFQSYKYLVECKSPNLVEMLGLFTKTAIEVCEGQQYDMDFENRMDVTVDEYLEMIRLKTAVLLACSLKGGAVLANASDEVSGQLYQFGINLGLAFQLQDDLLDTFGEQDTFGKKIGGDILANKKTFLLINALEKASGEQNAELLSWIEKTTYNPDEKIAAVKNIYTQVGVKQMAEEKVESYFKNAVEHLAAIQLDDVKKQPLLELANEMLIRRH